MKTLIAICCIDKRVLELQNCLKHLKNKDVIGVCREKDVYCQKAVNCLLVDNYEIANGTRHNIHGIATQRNKALSYARRSKYDRLIFIDSDIQVKWYTIAYLLLGTMFADISCIAYPIRWAAMQPVVGFDNPPSIKVVGFGWMPFEECSVAGMGCTCINVNSKKIPDRFVYGEALGIHGEDIGFFLAAKQNGASVLVAKWSIAEHRY